jgi:UDPglucose 6-dehydrogenase
MSTAEEAGYSLRIVDAAVKVNIEQRARIIEKIRRCAGGEVKNKTIGILGLAFKPNTDDIRGITLSRHYPPVNRRRGHC